jgi:hypothetical protein
VGYSCPISSKLFVNNAETIHHEDKNLLQNCLVLVVSMGNTLQGCLDVSSCNAPPIQKPPTYLKGGISCWRDLSDKVNIRYRRKSSCPGSCSRYCGNLSRGTGVYHIGFTDRDVIEGSSEHESRAVFVNAPMLITFELVDRSMNKAMHVFNCPFLNIHQELAVNLVLCAPKAQFSIQ